MKNIIIQRSISELQKNGLRFSIDKVAQSLNISKKTIYKYFSTKEELAIAIYETFYDDATNQIRLLEAAHPNKDILRRLLTVYSQSISMVREDIFNKYALNVGIRNLAQKNHRQIQTYFEKFLPQEYRDESMIIIDGSLQKLCETNANQEKVIDRLVTLLC